MCLPFCCRDNDPPQPQGAHDHPTGHRISHTEPVDDHPPFTGPGTGKEQARKNGNGADVNKDSGEVKNKMEGSLPTPEPKYSDTAEEVPSPTPVAPPRAPPSPDKHGGQKTEEEAYVAARTPEHTFRAPFPTAATKAPKKVEPVVASPRSHHSGTAVSEPAAARAGNSARTPPETQQIVGRGHEDDYRYPNPSASPTVVAVPAANNFRGDRGHGNAHGHAYVGKDDRKTPAGRTRQ